MYVEDDDSQDHQRFREVRLIDGLVRGTESATKLIDASLPAGIRVLLNKVPCILAGGAIRSFFDGSRSPDYDIFFYDMNGFRAADLMMSELFPVNRVHTSSYTHSYYTPNMKIQLVRPDSVELNQKKYTNPLELISQFDLTACQLAFTYENGRPTLHRTSSAIFHASTQTIVIANEWVRHSKEQFYMQGRIKKYIKKYGYTLELERMNEKMKEPATEAVEEEVTF